MAKADRISGLDFVKSLAALLVVYYHLIFPYPPDIASPGFRWVMVPYGLSAGLSICVPLFFISTGALSLRKEADISATLKRCGYFFFVLIFWGVFSLGLILLLRGESMTPRQFLYTLRDMPIGYIQHLWFLPSFLFMTLMTPVFQVLKKANPRVLYYFAAVIFVLTFGDKFLNECEYFLRWILGKTPYQSSRSFFGYVNFFKYHYWYMFVYFVLGIWLLENREALREKKKWVLTAIPLAFIYLGLYGVCHSQVYGETCDPVFRNYTSPATLLLTACVFLLLLWSRPGEKLSRFAASISRVSLGIYLIHWLLIEVIGQFLPGLLGNHLLAPVLAVVVFFLSYGISLLMTKIPGIRHLIQP